MNSVDSSVEDQSAPGKSDATAASSSAADAGRRRRRRARRILLWCGLSLALAVVITALWHRIPRGSILKPLRVPSTLLSEDFQRPLDRDVVEQFDAFEATGISHWIDANVLRPLIDDVTTRQMDVRGVEVSAIRLRGKQDLQAIAADCARILHMPPPRVYVTNHPGMNAYTTNTQDPIIVLHSSVIRRFHDPAELRFLIGHEMGHIRCRHVKLLMLLRGMVAAMPAGIQKLALLPLLKWSREGEMSADNAGLICSQSLATAERALIRLVLDLDDQSLERVDIDAYIAQGKRDVSDFADMLYFVSQVTSTHPFIPERLEQLREYADSESYRMLWR
jgi:Zn-dependent protease with chaperone function